MLTSVHIKNFRSCKDVKLEGLGALLGLVGRNATGKTTILEAIRQAARDALARDAFAARLEGPLQRLDPTAVDLEINTAGCCYRYSCETLSVRESVDVRAEHEVEWTRVLTRDRQALNVQGGRRFTVSREIAAMAALEALLPQEDAVNQSVGPLRDVLARVRYYPGHDEERDEKGDRAAEPSGLIHRDEFLRWANAVKATSASDPSILMRLLFAYERDRSTFNELEHLMGPEVRTG